MKKRRKKKHLFTSSAISIIHDYPTDLLRICGQLTQKNLFFPFVTVKETKLLYDDADFRLKHFVFCFVADNKYINSCQKKSFTIDTSKGKSSWSGESEKFDLLFCVFCLNEKLSRFWRKKSHKTFSFPLKWIVIFGRRSKFSARNDEKRGGRSSSK